MSIGSTAVDTTFGVLAEVLIRIKETGRAVGSALNER